MKELSFSSSVHQELKKSSKKWALLFLSLFCLEISLLTFIHYKQKLRLKQLLNEVSTLEIFVETQQPILETKSKLTQDYEALINKKASLLGNTALPKLVLKKIAKNLPADCRISTILFKNNNILIKGLAKNWNTLNGFFNTLSKENALGNARLKSTAKESSYLSFEIEFTKSKLTNKKRPLQRSSANE